MGKQVNSTWLREVLESTDIGTPGFKVLNLQTYGYQIVYASATDERVISESLAQGIPPIILLQTTALPYWNTSTAHAVVIKGSDNEQFTLCDPAFPSVQSVPRDALMLAWSDMDYLYTIIRPI